MHFRAEEQGNVVQIRALSYMNHEATIKRISGSAYVVVASGEICEYVNHYESRADSAQSVRKTFAKLRGIINANCTEPEKLRWVTLTYAENMTDTVRLYEDFGAFWKRCKRRYGHLEYIVVMEPQERGAWHAHLIMIFPEKAPFIPNDDLAKLWGHGFVTVREVSNVDNMGAYLSAYLADIEVPMDSEVGTVKVMQDGTKKKVVKGGRLGMYPAGMNIYRTSRGIKRPEVVDIESIGQLEEIVGDAVLTYSNEREIDVDGFEIKISNWWFNKARVASGDDVKGLDGIFGGAKQWSQ